MEHDMQDIVASERRPSVRDYVGLRAQAGWGKIDEETARRSIEAATFTVCLHCGDRLIGVARVMGDGVLYFFLADLIVDTEFRGERLGDRLMKMVTNYFDRSARQGASIMVISLKGVEAFYERFGFVQCPDGPFGAGMHYRAAPPPAG